MLDKIRFAKSMTLIFEIYDRELTKTLQDVYYALLKDMQDEDFKQAVRRMLQERTTATLPKPAEILAYSNVKKVDVIEIDETTIKAKEMIQAVETMNTILYKECHMTGKIFADYVKEYEFEKISDESKSILSNVKPFCNYRLLIINIRQYQTSIDALNAFKNAIKLSEQSGGLEISLNVRKMIGKG